VSVSGDAIISDARQPVAFFVEETCRALTGRCERDAFVDCRGATAKRRRPKCGQRERLANARTCHRRGPRDNVDQLVEACFGRDLRYRIFDIHRE
jgi:hypothetical protein